MEIQKGKSGQKLNTEKLNAVYVTWMFLGLGLAFIVTELQMNAIFGSSVMSARVSAELSANISEQTIADNMEMISLLREENWRELTVPQRLEVLTVVGIVEQDYLGLANELNVYAANLPEYTQGYYNDSKHEMVMNVDYLLNYPSGEILGSFLHEVYHSFEYRCSEVYMDAD